MAWNGLGWANFNSGNRAEARRAFQQVLKIEPKFAPALNGLGQLALSERKYDEAEKYLLQAAPTATAAWYGLSCVYLLTGKYDQAAKWAKKAVDSGEGDDTADEMLTAAKSHSLPDDLRQQIEPPELADDEDESVLPADISVPRGWQLINQGRRDEAQTIFAQLIARTPTNADALNGMGWLLLTGGDVEEAKPYFERALKSQPGAGAR